MRDDKTNKIVMTGLMMCLVTVSTMFIKMPVIATQGYVHLGDSMIFLSILILGRKNGTIAAGVGSAMGDILGGYAFWAPWTLIIKSLMAFIMGTFIDSAEKRGKLQAGSGGISFIEIIGMILAGIEMTVGYYLVETVMYGSLIVPIASIPWNVGQFVLGVVVASAIAAALLKTPAKKFFAIKTGNK